MAHEILGASFFNADARKPAWHGLGITADDDTPRTAVEVLDMIGEYVVDRVPIVTIEGHALNQTALVRRAHRDDPRDVVFGIVSTEYELITPNAFATLFDGSVGKPVETMGVLREGRVMFVTTQLPTIDVKGDEVEMYLIARNGMDGKTVAGCDLSPVRVVCQNTLTLSESYAHESFRVVHTQGAAKQLGTWMHDAYEHALARVSAVKDAMGALAATRVDAQIVDETVAVAYPFRPEPSRNAPDDVMQKRIERWEYDTMLVGKRRDAVRELFDGAMTGYDEPELRDAIRGTAWGLYNAVVEVEEYRRGITPVVTAEDRLFGKRAATKALAFDHLVALAK